MCRYSMGRAARAGTPHGGRFGQRQGKRCSAYTIEEVVHSPIPILGQMFCLKCRKPWHPAGLMVDFVASSPPWSSYAPPAIVLATNRGHRHPQRELSLIAWCLRHVPVSTITHIDGASATSFDGCADTPASPRASRACCRARGRQDQAFGGPSGPVLTATRHGSDLDVWPG